MALKLHRGSIGPDIEKAPLDKLEAFYGGKQVPWSPTTRRWKFQEPSGSKRHGDRAE